MNQDRLAGGWLFHEVHIGLIRSPSLYSSFTAEMVGFRLGVSAKIQTETMYWFSMGLCVEVIFYLENHLKKVK
jgi:hypothetical protein